MNKRILAIAVGVIALLLIGWYVISPSMALRSLREAVKSGDATELAAIVDFPVLKADLKTQLQAQMAEKMVAEQDKGNPFAAVGMAFGSLIVDRMIDAFVTPAGLSKLFAQGNPSERSDNLDDLQYSIDRQGLSHFTARIFKEVDRDAQKTTMSFGFARDGISWKLSTITLPSDPIKPTTD